MENHMPSPIPIPGRRSPLRRRMLLALASVLALTSLLGVGASSALAVPPTATTNAATSITQTSAKLNGFANSPGVGTAWQFEYGKTAAYGQKTPWVEPGIPIAENVSATIGMEDSEYHFRLVVKNTEGTSFGADKVAEYVGTWHSQPSENAAADISRLQDASCFMNGGTPECSSAGFSESSGSGGLPLAAKTVFSGKWTLQTIPPLGLTGHRLEGISCISTSNCVAVGYYNNGTARHALAEHWNGKEWKPFLFPAVGGSSSQLNGVSCTSATNCVAVGQLKDVSTTKPVVVRWSGSEWYNEVPTPGGPEFGRMLDVSCVSLTACTAVGSTSPANNALIWAWNGTAWKSQTPASSVGLVLDAVSCAAANACTAVSETSPANTLVAQRWNGTKWETQTTATLTGATAVKGLDVTCITATRCIAVGSYVNGSSVGTALIERWNSTSWTAQTAPAAPAGSSNPTLWGVSCAKPSWCSAVGGYDTEAGKGQTFATSLY
jgi:hypothetical protein